MDSRYSKATLNKQKLVKGSAKGIQDASALINQVWNYVGLKLRKAYWPVIVPRSVILVQLLGPSKPALL